MFSHPYISLFHLLVNGFSVIHIYLASMKNCSKSPEQLIELIMNIVKQYQIHIYKVNKRCLSVSSIIGGGDPNKRISLAKKKKKQKVRGNEYCFEIIFSLVVGTLAWGREKNCRGKNSMASHVCVSVVTRIG